MTKEHKYIVAAVSAACCIISVSFVVLNPFKSNVPRMEDSMQSAANVVEVVEDNDNENIQIECGASSLQEYADKGEATPVVKTVSVKQRDMVYDHDTEIKAVVDLVNAYRVNASLPPVEMDLKLMKVAGQRAKEAAESFSHTRPNGLSCFTVLDEMECKYWCAGENIAFGQRHASWVMEDWMNSPGHKANILYADYTHIGIGLYEDENGVLYWSQMFTD